MDGWNDNQVADAMRQTLKTLIELRNKLGKRGYDVTLDSHPTNYIPTRVTSRKTVIL
jgi:hypothetical protein